MSIPAYSKIKVYPNGKRVRMYYDTGGNVVKVTPIVRKQTKSRKRLAKAHRRIGHR